MNIVAQNQKISKRTRRPEHDPIELQCGTEKLHAIISITTETLSNCKSHLHTDTLCMLYRIQDRTFWLKETCFDIHEERPLPLMVDELIKVCNRIESLAKTIMLWQQQVNALAEDFKCCIDEAIDLAKECKAETKRLWG